MEMKRNFSRILVAVLMITNLIGCGRVYKRWWYYGNDWQSTEGYIHLYDSAEEGWLISFREPDGNIEYKISRSNNGGSIDIYEKDNVNLDNVVMAAETRIANGKLELTFTTDKVLGLTGTTYVLELVGENETSEGN